MAKKLFVGNLPWSVTTEQLNDLFGAHGDIEEAIVMTDKFSGRSRGFGFVTFVNDADADKAVEALNGHNIEGRDLTVNEARPPRERGDM